MKKLLIYSSVLSLLFLWACGQNVSKQSSWNQSSVGENTNQIQTIVKNTSSFDDSLLSSPEIKNNMEEYVKIKQIMQAKEEEKKQAIKAIENTSKTIEKTIWEKISVVGMINNIKYFKKEEQQLEKINSLAKRVSTIQDENTRKKILQKIQEKKEQVYKTLKQKWMLEKEIKALDKFASLPEKQKKELEKQIEEVETYTIPEAGGIIVSREFKDKYEIAKNQLINSIPANTNTNWPIPYEMVVQYMLQQELIKEGKCDKLQNDILKAECEWRKQNGY